MSANTTPETFKFSCTGCGARLTVKKTTAGKRIKCPKCRQESVCTPPIQSAPTPPKDNRSPAAAKKPAKSAAKVQPAPIPAPVDSASEEAAWTRPAPAKKPALAKPAASPRDDDTSGVSSLAKWGGAAVVAVLGIVGLYYLFAMLYSGPSIGSLSGKVFYGDTPVNSGTVAFFPKSGVPVRGTIQSDGSYQAKGIERGELIITVMQLNPKFKDMATRRKEAKNKAGNLAEDTEPMHLLPEIYAEATTSPLRFTLQKSSDTYDIRLSKE